jgi:hypothetical protein
MKRIFLIAAATSVLFSGVVIAPALAYPPPAKPLVPIVSTDTGLQVQAHVRELQNGEILNLPAGELVSAPGMVQTVYWDRKTRSYVAEQRARETRYLVNPARYVMIGLVRTPD